MRFLKYENSIQIITGQSVPEKQVSCGGCCFYSQELCIPYDVFPCREVVFKKTKNDIFKT